MVLLSTNMAVEGPNEFMFVPISRPFFGALVIADVGVPVCTPVMLQLKLRQEFLLALLALEGLLRL